jgi:ferrous iron transport protein A
MNAQPSPASFALALDELAFGRCGRIATVDWAALGQHEAARLRHFGFDDDVTVEPLHGGPLGRDPMAVRVGRMTVAIRRAHARAIRVVPAS